MGGATPPRSSESFILVGTSTTAHENGRFVSLRSFGGRRGISGSVERPHSRCLAAAAGSTWHVQPSKIGAVRFMWN